MHRAQFKRSLLTSTAMAVIMLAAPSFAQTMSSDGNGDRNQTSNQREMKQRYSNRDRVTWRNYSDQRHFSKVNVAAASDLVGKTVGSDDGGASGDIEYILIEPVSGKVMYFLVGMGGMMTANQDLAVVPWEAVNISRNQNGENLSVTLRAGAQTLRNAPELTDSQLDELTSPRFQVRVRNYWAPVTEDRQQGAANGGQDRNGRQASRQDSRSQNDRSFGYERQYYRDDGSVWGGRRSVVPDDAETRGDRQASRQDGQSNGTDRQADRQADRSTRDRDVDDMMRGAERARQLARGDNQNGSDQAWNQQSRDQQTADRQAQNGQSQDRQAETGQRQDRQAQDRQAQSSRDQARQGQNGDQAYTLVARSYITALMPPSVMRPDQLRGASVANRNGDEIGALERLVIDTERGYVAYALVSEGGFLGIGESYNPVPIQALTWVAGEKFVLPVTTEELRSMPKLETSDLPTSVRRTHLERMYNEYNARPYWEQARINQQDDASTGRDQRDRQMSDRQTENRQSRGRDQEQSDYRRDNGGMRDDRDRQN